MVFFMEIKLNNKWMEGVRRRCDFANGKKVGANGFKGGLCMAWKEDLSVSLRIFSSNFFKVPVQSSDGNPIWRFTRFYDSRFGDTRNDSWDSVRRIGSSNALPWSVCRDFNEILYVGEKKGRLSRDEKRMALFRNTLKDCNLVYVGFSGVVFT